MIKYDDKTKTMIATCDVCGESVEFEAENFSRAIEMLKNDGWLSHFKDGTWTNFCCLECKQRQKETESYLNLSSF